MNILAINASPHKSRGNTHLILEPFLQGAEEAGAETESFFLYENEIGFCIGCLSCAIKTPGVCVLLDDMKILIDKVRETDILIIASPLYIDGLTAICKAFIDRLAPLLSYELTMRNGHCRHLYSGRHCSKLFLISSCGFYELDNFESMIDHINKICANLNMEYLGNLLRPAAHLMRDTESFRNEIEKTKKFAYQAGKEIVINGKVSASTMNNVSAPFTDMHNFIHRSNEYSKKIVERMQ